MKITGLRNIKHKDFISFFNANTGAYVRSGILKNGKDTGEDPFMADFPELLDIGVMGHCAHGQAGLCKKSGVECYQRGGELSAPNMSLEDFQRILSQCRGKVYQVALGGRGDPDMHENFPELLKACREHGIVPNFTTSGYGMTPQKAKLCKKYCGAVAISWYGSSYTTDAIAMLQNAGVKTNIHFVVSKSSIDEAIARLKNSLPGETDRGFPFGINAVIFLLHKPVGQGRNENVLSPSDSKLKEFLSLIDRENFPFKIGFDSCFIPGLIHNCKVNMTSVDTCEGGRFSAYISSDMLMMPCSFDNQEGRFAESLEEKKMSEIWQGEKFASFRSHLKNSCPGCEKQRFCMGGCPLIPEIVLCDRLERKSV